MLRRLIARAVLVLLLHQRDLEAITQGCLRLDALTFDKMLSTPGYSFAVKIDEPAGWGDKRKAFETFCKLSYAVPNFFAAELPIQRFNNNKENDEMRVRFNLTREEFPAYYLFNDKNPLPNGLRYTGPAQAPNILGWLRDNGIMMPSIDTIDELDVLALKFVDAADAAIIEKAKTIAKNFATDPKAEIYVKTMEKIMVKGQQYPKDEINRVSILLQGQLTKEKISSLHDKLRVLKVFAKIKACDVFECPKNHKKKFDAEGIIGHDEQTCCNQPCEDIDGENHDEQGHDCSYYNSVRTTKECGTWDNGEFRAYKLCCSCGGGQITE